MDRRSQTNDKNFGGCEEMKAYTDYPLYPSECGKKAPVREVTPISYDGDKYVTVEYEGEIFEFKSGYLYSEEGRFDEVPTFPFKTLQVKTG